MCWFLGKNLSNFVSSIWKLHNPYCHNVSGDEAITLPLIWTKCLSNWNQWEKSNDFLCIQDNFLQIKSHEGFLSKEKVEIWRLILQKSAARLKWLLSIRLDVKCKILFEKKKNVYYRKCQNGVKINLILAPLNQSVLHWKKLKVFCFSVLIFLEQQPELPDILLYVSNKNNLTVSNNFTNFGIF